MRPKRLNPLEAPGGLGGGARERTIPNAAPRPKFRDGVSDFSCATFLGVPGTLFWFAPLQREGMRSPGRKVGASAVREGRAGYRRSSIAPMFRIV